jgi:hypothetical protein
MRWTPWFTGVYYGYRQGGNGTYVELGYFPNNELVEPTIFLQDERATTFVDAVERIELDEKGLKRRNIQDALDDLIAEEFDIRML